MQIELSKDEVVLIDKALSDWENAATQGALMGSVFSAMLAPKDAREEMKSAADNEISKAEIERDSRRRKATMLRAKLFSAETRASEHNITETRD